MRVILTATLALSLAFACAAQRRHSIYLTEVLVDPIGTNSGQQVAEIWNDYNQDLDTSGWYLVTGSDSTALPAVKIPAYAILRIHFGKQGISGPADIFLPNFKDLGTSDSIALFKSNQFQNPNDIVDFVSWNGGQGHIFVAAAAGEWASSLRTVALPKSEGASIAHYAKDSYGHNSNSEEAWFQDKTPTMGLVNDTASIYSMYSGCTGYANKIWMGLQTKLHRPWVGEAWEVTIYNMLQGTGNAWIIFGVQSGVAVPMAPYGLPGCNLMVSPDIIIPVNTTATVGTFSMWIPHDVNLVGSKIYLQSFVRDSSVQNAAQALMTNSLIAELGSR